MKIFYIQGDYPFCYFYRGYLPGVYSNQIVVQDFLRQDMNVSDTVMYDKAMQADVICFQRPSSESAFKLAQLLKLKGKKIIFDNDDTYSGIPLARLGSEKRVEVAKQLNVNLNKFLEMADGATTSTKTLKEEYSKINPNVAVLKNCIDPLDEFPVKKNTTGKFRIGLIGSVTSNDDYIHIKDDLKRIDERGDCTIVIMGVKFFDGKVMPSMQEDYDFWASLKNVEWHPVCHVTEYMHKISQLALDLAIIPRKEHYFNECKSNLKFLEMSLLKIPVVAQGFTNNKSPYQGKDSKYMTVIVDNPLVTGKWYDKIIEIKDDYQTYSDLAIAAHDYVLKNYNIKTYAETWTKTIKKLISKNK